MHFTNMLKKLQNASLPDHQKEAEPSFWNYFSTHPSMDKRIIRLQEKVIRNPA